MNKKNAISTIARTERMRRLDKKVDREEEETSNLEDMILDIYPENYTVTKTEV
jgi:uncharacterized protein (UPF0335 family)